MPKTMTATASETINAPASEVWDALVKPEKIKQYLFGSEVESDFKEGSPIFYRGEWQGKRFEDKGMVLKVDPQRQLISTHWSPLSGTADTPENYHEVSYTLQPEGPMTRLSISQDNNADEGEAQHSTEMWELVLKNLKELLEK